MQCHSASYPISARSPRTRPNHPPGRPDGPPSRFETFSRMMNSGRRSPASRAISDHSPLRVPSPMPACAPATLMSWQGKPPVMTSTAIPSAARRSAVSSLTSLYCLTVGQCFASTARQNGLISQKATVSKPPVRSRPRLKPPMPENRSRTFSTGAGLHRRSKGAQACPPAGRPSRCMIGIGVDILSQEEC